MQICSDNDFIKAVVNHGILVRCHPTVGRNVMIVIRHYNWSLDDFISGQLRSAYIMVRYLSTVLSEVILFRSVYFATELLHLREHSYK